MPASLDVIAETLREAASPLTGAPDDYSPLLEMIGDARFVLLGEATHGTHEFYKARAEIIRRVINEINYEHSRNPQRRLAEVL